VTLQGLSFLFGFPSSCHFHVVYRAVDFMPLSGLILLKSAFKSFFESFKVSRDFVEV